MSAEEIQDPGAREDERRSSRRFAIKLVSAILLLFALTVGALYVLFAGRLRRSVPAQNTSATSNVYK